MMSARADREMQKPKFRTRALRAVAWAAACAVLGAGAAGAAEQKVGVAPFEQSGSGGGPDMATRLADRLTTAGVACVGPERLGVPAVAEPEPAQVQSWSQGAGVDTMVFGRVTGIGSRYSVDVQLRSAATGQVTSVHVTEITRADGVDAAVADLTRKVLQGLSGEPAPGAARPTSVAKAPAAAPGSAPPVAARPPSRKREGGLLGSGSGPLRITSDDLEARVKDGARHMIFTDNVRATRDDVVLTANRLDAFYPKGSSRPDRIVATGNVVMNRAAGEAHCQKMTYLESDGRIHCEGNAELVREGDRARGDKIEWDVETDTIFIKGNADVLLVDDAGSPGGS